MSVDLVVASAISGSPTPVLDQNGNQSAISLSTQQVSVIGTDQVGGSMPESVAGKTSTTAYSNGTTWGRLIRFQDQGTSNVFYDIGIDRNGNLFFNSPGSTASQHVLTLSQTGTLTVNAMAIGQLQLSGLTTPPAGVTTVDVVVDPTTGNLYRQS